MNKWNSIIWAFNCFLWSGIFAQHKLWFVMPFPAILGIFLLIDSKLENGGIDDETN